MAPRDGGDADEWLAGYQLRDAHRPAGGSSVCPACVRPWPCGGYLDGIAMMQAALRPPGEDLPA